jgi:glucose-6-phosphate-specific signal transduction histidine kinase
LVVTLLVVGPLVVTLLVVGPLLVLLLVVMLLVVILLLVTRLCVWLLAMYLLVSPQLGLVFMPVALPAPVGVRAALRCWYVPLGTRSTVCHQIPPGLIGDEYDVGAVSMVVAAEVTKRSRRVCPPRAGGL